ncbi:MAG: PIN domain nuclease [Rhizobiales bacterium PAR1]|nr:MAG: PIN domain nuclease [Rhizobiales bacterium PAR1]
MRLLLDTHIAIWALVAPDRLTQAEQTLIASLENEEFVSSVSLWEIAIKFPLSRGRVDALPFSAEAAHRYFLEAGYHVLDMTARHALAVETLPPLHADPFDRMLVAQARTEPMHLLSQDQKVLAYFPGDQQAR